ncbi:hypothetical protein PAXRUDRAFT_20290 [Paxillus rubicundulus Ve08.2h10]|uniref:Unplaced genomic scaffold scaffold_4409, whole genome shotgun sequence n=1 Tax=Paxillus rubicundulus Ve08.2h10 TaxID=930991 RepID=A0A0D0CF05_9AGAM|nr:hypothetical protein PAXRUDRAFT_20290 [Paxillus rubicundulus Ve08.2h10]
MRCVNLHGKAPKAPEAAKVLASQAICPICTTVPTASPSAQTWLATPRGDEEGEVIVVRAGKGKAVSGQAKGVMSKVQDT